MDVDHEDPKQGLYLGWMLCAASVRTAGQESPTAIPCRRRPGRKPCGGHMRVMLTEVPELLAWRCPECGDRGSIGPWRQNVWSLRDWMLEKVSTGEIETTVTPHEYRLLREAICGPTVMVATATLMPDGNVRLSGDHCDADDLLLALTEVPSAQRRGERGRALDRVRRRIEGLRSADPRFVSSQPLEGRDVLTAFARGAAPDARMRQLMRKLCASFPVPFEAKLGRVDVRVESVTFWDGDLPELRGRTVFEGQRVEINLGAFRVDGEAGSVQGLIMLYRDWWNRQRGGQSKDA